MKSLILNNAAHRNKKELSQDLIQTDSALKVIQYLEDRIEVFCNGLVTDKVIESDRFELGETKIDSYVLSIKETHPPFVHLSGIVHL